MMSPVTDTELLERWSFGDQQAGSLLLTRHRRALYGFLGRRASRDVDDLAQQTLLACIERRQWFRAESSFLRYLLQIARYQVYAHYRMRKRESHGQDAQLQADAPLPLEVLMREQDLRSVELALTRLPAIFREVLQLSFFEDLSGPEIAERLRIPAPTVRSRTRRALAHLRRELSTALARSSNLRCKIDGRPSRLARGSPGRAGFHPRS